MEHVTGVLLDHKIEDPIRFNYANADHVTQVYADLVHFQFAYA